MLGRIGSCTLDAQASASGEFPRHEDAVAVGHVLAERFALDEPMTAVQRHVSDVFSPGTRVPSIREFARSYGVSRFTVVEAYDRLVAMGYLEARRGSGFYTTPRPTD